MSATTIRCIKLVQLGELSGREYFDAVVDVSRISSVIVRVKE